MTRATGVRATANTRQRGLFKKNQRRQIRKGRKA